MTLGDFTHLGLIIPQLRGEDPASAIQELSQVLQREKRVPDSLRFYETALNHEFLVSSDTEAGIAFPNARVPGLNEVCFALGRRDEPMRWGMKGTRSVRLVFLLAVPTTDATQYLLVVSGIARFSKETELVARLHSGADAAGMLAVLQQFSLAPTPFKNR